MSDNEPPEINSPFKPRDPRDMADLMRKGQIDSSKGYSLKSLPLGTKLLAAGLLGLLLMTGIWVFTGSDDDEGEIPEIMAEGDGSFKTEPGEKETLKIPHEDKHLYAALDKRSDNFKNSRDKIVDAPEETIDHNKEGESTTALETGSDHISKKDKDAMAQENPPGVEVIDQPGTRHNQSPEDMASHLSPNPQDTQGNDHEAGGAMIETGTEASADQKVVIVQERNVETQPQDLQSQQKAAVIEKPAAQETPIKSKSDMKAPAPQASAPVKSLATKTRLGRASAKPAQESYWLQVGSLPTAESAEREKERIMHLCRDQISGRILKIKRVDLGRKLGIRYRIYCGTFDNRKDAISIQKKLAKKKIDSFVAKL